MVNEWMTQVRHEGEGRGGVDRPPWLDMSLNAGIDREEGIRRGACAGCR
jgi:hypothetical protein